MLGSRNDSRKNAVEPKVSPAPVQTMPDPTPVPRAQTPSSSQTAVIGPKIRFKGELVGEEDLIIQGQVDGSIDLKGHNLTIGEHGVIKANLLGKTVTIRGTVEGDVFGEERISIMSSSNVKGNLTADRVVLEDGAKFRGSIDMDPTSNKEKLKKASASSSESHHSDSHS